MWGKMLHPHPLTHVLTPTAIWRALLLKVEPRGPYFLTDHKYAVANTYMHKMFDGYVQLTF